ncbi:MAG TPA: signal peptidase II [Thermomicrobiales bacterium]|nr:signal peptidase II [Thermomicrobiales bacterium]
MPQPRILHTGRLVVLAIAVLVVALDLVSKWIIVSMMDLGESRWLVQDQIGLELVHNRRFAFSLGPASGYAQIVAIVAVIVVGYLLLTNTFGTGFVVHIGTGLILGGALGNTIDRIARGFVVDFFAVGAFPRFNIADAALTLGIACLLLGQFRQGSTTSDR